MRNLLYLLLPLVLSSHVIATAQSSTVLTNQVANGSVYKLATLPGDSLNTYDHLHITATLNSGWGGFANSVVDAVFSTRQGFVYLYTVKGAKTTSAAKLAAYQNADGSVDLYMMFSPGYTTGSYTILDSIQEHIYPDPPALGYVTPPGTLVFDTSSPNYPAAETLDFTGNFEIDGSASIDGLLNVGSSDGGLYGDHAGTVVQPPVGGSVYLARIGVDGTRVSQSDGTFRIGGPAQPNAGLLFPDGSLQLHAAAATVGSNGITTIMNAEGTAGFQFKPGLQGIGGAFGAGGNLSLQANPVTDLSNTGGFINLGGSARGDSLVNKVVIAGNTVPTTNAAASGLAGVVVNGLNNVGIGIDPTKDPNARLEVNGDIMLTQHSAAKIIFSDGSVQSSAWPGIQGGDFAELIDVDGIRSTYEAGDLLVIEAKRPGYFSKSSESYSKLVAGVYSTKPGLTGRRATSARINEQQEVPMALVGIVPIKVTSENGPIHPGDMLVSSSSPGYAMRGSDQARLRGSVIGKAIGELLNGVGTIEALLSMQ